MIDQLIDVWRNFSHFIFFNMIQPKFVFELTYETFAKSISHEKCIFFSTKPDIWEESKGKTDLWEGKGEGWEGGKGEAWEGGKGEGWEGGKGDGWEGKGEDWEGKGEGWRGGEGEGGYLSGEGGGGLGEFLPHQLDNTPPPGINFSVFTKSFFLCLSLFIFLSI